MNKSITQTSQNEKQVFESDELPCRKHLGIRALPTKYTIKMPWLIIKPRHFIKTYLFTKYYFGVDLLWALTLVLSRLWATTGIIFLFCLPLTLLFVLAMLLPLFRIKSTPTGKNALFNLYYFFTGLVFEPTGILNAFFP